jgi:hypothetical protein
MLPVTGRDIFLISSTMTSTGLLDAALHFHRVGASHHVARAFAINRLREHCRRGRAVAGRVRGLARDLAHHLRAHVLERILQVDLLGHRHTVLGDGGGAELLVEDDVCVPSDRG